MRALVTGGAGFIGSHLVDALASSGAEVVVLDDLSTGKRDNLAHHRERVTLRVGSVTDPETVRAAMEGCAVVYHLAAVASVQRSVEEPLWTNAVNFGGTLHVLEAARAVGTRRVVLASSAAVYGAGVEAPAHEDDRPDPQTPYAIEKLQSEHYLKVWARLFGLETVALRFFNVFGPRQDPGSPYSGVISIFAERLVSNQPVTIFGDGEQTRDFIYVADVVDALRAAGATEGAEGLVCNVGRGERTSLNALYQTLASLTGGSTVPRYAEPRPGDIRHSLADVRRARERLGFRARATVAEGLARLLTRTESKTTT